MANFVPSIGIQVAKQLSVPTEFMQSWKLFAEKLIDKGTGQVMIYKKYTLSESFFRDPYLEFLNLFYASLSDAFPCNCRR